MPSKYVGAEQCSAPTGNYIYLLTNNRCELFCPAIIGHTIGLSVTTRGNRSLPEINLVEIIETIGLATFGAEQITGGTSRRHSWVGTKPRSHITLHFWIK